MHLARKYLRAGRIGLFSEVPFEMDKLAGNRICGGKSRLSHLGLCWRQRPITAFKSFYQAQDSLFARRGGQDNFVNWQRFLIFSVNGATDCCGASQHVKTNIVKQVLIIRSDEGRWGCLTHGERCDFYYLRKRTAQTTAGESMITGYDCFELTEVNANGDDGLSIVMGTVYEEVCN